MADRRGTGGRGSLSTLGEGWGEVSEDAKIVRMRTEPSPLVPFVRSLLAVDQIGKQVERFAPAEDGKEPQPATYSKAEAIELRSELRRAGAQLKLTQRRLSLRIKTDPANLDEAPDNTRVRVQVVVEKRKPAEEATES